MSFFEEMMDNLTAEKPKSIKKPDDIIGVVGLSDNREALVFRDGGAAIYDCDNELDEEVVVLLPKDLQSLVIALVEAKIDDGTIRL